MYAMPVHREREREKERGTYAFYAGQKLENLYNMNSDIRIQVHEEKDHRYQLERNLIKMLAPFIKEVEFSFFN